MALETAVDRLQSVCNSSYIISEVLTGTLMISSSGTQLLNSNCTLHDLNDFKLEKKLIASFYLFGHHIVTAEYRTPAVRTEDTVLKRE